MNTRITAAAAIALFAVLLSGCGEDATPAAEPAPFAASVSETPEPTPETTEKPLQAAPAPDRSDADATFLFEVKKRTDIATIVQASDDQLIAAGHAACEALAVDPDIENLRLVEGEQPTAHSGRYMDSVVIGYHATMFICPEYKPAPLG